MTSFRSPVPPVARVIQKAECQTAYIFQALMTTNKRLIAERGF